MLGNYKNINKTNPKTYKQVALKFHMEWKPYEVIQIISQKNECSTNAVMIYYLVEGLKKDGYKPSAELQAFIDNNYKNKKG